MLIKDLEDDAPELELISDDDDEAEELLEGEEVSPQTRNPKRCKRQHWGQRWRCRWWGAQRLGGCMHSAPVEVSCWMPA